MKKNQLQSQLTTLGLIFDEDFYHKCEQYKRLLQEWGKIHNLTAPKSLTDDEIENNIIDSVYPLTLLDPIQSLLDVGTGAGYPGIILAFALPHTRIILAEPRAKRVAFLNYIKTVLGLKNVTIEPKRVENIELAPDQRCDLITSRAVTNTKLLLELTRGCSDLNTSYLFYKGSLCESEIESIDSCEVPYQLTHKIVNFGVFRNYLIIKKKVSNDF